MAALVYIIYSEKTSKFYVGHTENLENRLVQHNSRRNLSTKSGAPWILMYIEQFETKAQAANREAEIKKKKSRKYNEQLIKSAS